MNLIIPEIKDLIIKKQNLEELLGDIAISPAIMSGDINTVKDLIKVYHQIFEKIDIDINDNSLFDGTKTIDTEDLPNILHTLSYTGLKDPLLGLHLLVTNFEKYIPPHIVTIVENICFQYESINVYDSELPLLLKRYKSLKKNIKIGVSISPNRQKEFKYILEHDYRALDLFDYIQIMTINPGRQGNEFMESTLEIIPIIRKFYPSIWIKLDGGINPKTLMDISTNGIEIIKNNIQEVSVGSYFLSK